MPSKVIAVSWIVAAFLSAGFRVARRAFSEKCLFCGTWSHSHHMSREAFYFYLFFFLLCLVCNGEKRGDRKEKGKNM